MIYWRCTGVYCDILTLSIRTSAMPSMLSWWSFSLGRRWLEGETIGSVMAAEIQNRRRREGRGRGGRREGRGEEGEGRGEEEEGEGRGEGGRGEGRRGEGGRGEEGHSFSLLVKFFNFGNVAKDDPFLSLQAVRKKIGGKSWTTFLHRGRRAYGSSRVHKDNHAVN